VTSRGVLNGWKIPSTTISRTVPHGGSVELLLLLEEMTLGEETPLAAADKRLATDVELMRFVGVGLADVCDDASAINAIGAGNCLWKVVATS